MPARTVVITGASAGIGRAVAQAFAERTWSIGLIARDRERLDVAAETLRANGAGVLVLPCDVADPGAVEQVADRVAESWGGIDVWINAAMVTVFSIFAEMTPDEYRRVTERVTEVTYLGQVHGTRAALMAGQATVKARSFVGGR
ncbi:MAG TPA: SDR family NAD(P)-dependent oxidoreductase [Kaistia sp.]|jgi:NAD(P)-dependent dehydrogenase (short-subunit alcohol dehydrogenase family)|nr:SDR family NAD(P)-dependent oxidoreductase [Kaistia sp.]